MPFMDMIGRSWLVFFFFNNTAPTEIYTLSLHDALPICGVELKASASPEEFTGHIRAEFEKKRSEEHTSELQSHHDLVCRLLLEKKKKRVLIRATNIFRLKLSRTRLPMRC